MTSGDAGRLKTGLLALFGYLTLTFPIAAEDGHADNIVPAAAARFAVFSKHGTLRTTAWSENPAPPPLAAATQNSRTEASFSGQSIDSTGCQAGGCETSQTVVINLSPGALLTALEARLNVTGLPPTHPLAGSAAAFVDSALIGNRLRLRYDGLWSNPRPDRAELITARNQAVGNGRGFLQPETNLDLQEFFTQVEMMLSPRCSLFIEMPLRSVNPEVNPNRTNIGDLNAGFKLAYSVEPDLVQTFQLRVYVPTGSADDGLGVGHPSLEPALLVWQRLPNNWLLEAEIRDWIAIGGTMTAGNVLRYGLSLSRDYPWAEGAWLFRPVAELLGWTILRGRETVVVPLNPELSQFHTIDSETRSTIIQLNLGLRLGSSTSDVYLGWSHALTGPRWFAEGFRLEYRWHF